MFVKLTELQHETDISILQSVIVSSKCSFRMKRHELGLLFSGIMYLGNSYDVDENHFSSVLLSLE